MDILEQKVIGHKVYQKALLNGESFCIIPYGHVTWYTRESYAQQVKNLDDVGLYCNVPLGHVAEKSKLFQ